MFEQHMQDARAFLNQASHSFSLAEAEIDAFQKKADGLKPKAEEFDRVTEKLAAQSAALSSVEAKLAAVQAAHQKFAKLVTG